MSLLMRVPPNLVQSIRAYRASELQKEAGRLGHHFLYAHCANALTKQQVCARIGEQFTFPQASAARISMRCVIASPNVIAEAGPQPGFIAVLDQLPNTQKFDKEARETLLDVFRDAAEFWAEKKVPFRVFYSFEEPQSLQSVGWVGPACQAWSRACGPLRFLAVSGGAAPPGSFHWLGYNARL
jgi:hypothetical protein